jgi:prepilin peptidase CpaA
MPEMTAFHLSILAVSAFVLITAAVNDVRHYKIPNSLCLILLLLFPIYVLTAPDEVKWLQHIMIFGLTLLAGFMLFVSHFAGGGDVKLFAVMGLWAGPHYISSFLVITAIAGGLVAIVMAVIFARRKALVTAEGQNLTWHKAPIPYGVAIAVGGLSTLFFHAERVLG